METISSRQNPKVKYICSLYDRHCRAAEGSFIVEGYRACERLFQSNYSVEALYYCSEFWKYEHRESSEALLQSAQNKFIPVFSTSKSVFEKISYREHPDGVLAISKIKSMHLDQLEFSDNLLMIILEGVEKPGNLGSIIRSAQAVGANALILCDSTVDPYNPNVIRASQGLIFSCPLVLSTNEATLAYCLKNQIQLVTTSPHASKIFWEEDFTQSTAIVMGSEKTGLSPFWLQSKLSTSIKIPIIEAADSLNVSTATALILYEALRQREVYRYGALNNR
jgi:TrmH family RNA methyltransferase